MSKRSIKHINGNKNDSQAMADSKQQELVDINWDSTPTWNMIEFHRNPPLKSEYKFFGEDKKEDSGE